MPVHPLQDIRDLLHLLYAVVEEGDLVSLVGKCIGQHTRKIIRWSIRGQPDHDGTVATRPEIGCPAQAPHNPNPCANEHSCREVLRDKHYLARHDRGVRQEDSYCFHDLPGAGARPRP